MTKPETIPVPRPVVEGVINYLATRPYKEVAEGIQHLGAALQQADQKAQDLDQPVDRATERAVNHILRENGTTKATAMAEGPEN